MADPRRLGTYSCTECHRDMAVLVGGDLHITGVCLRCTAHPGWHRQAASPATVVPMLVVPGPAAGGVIDPLDEVAADHLALVQGRAPAPRTARAMLIRQCAELVAVIQQLDREGAHG